MNSGNKNVERYNARKLDVIPSLAGRIAFKLKYKNDPLAGLHHLSARYGNTIHVRLFSDDFLLLSDPSAMKYILQENSTDYIRHGSFDPMALIFGQSFFSPAEEHWEYLLKAAAPIFDIRNFGRFDAFLGEELEALKSDWFRNRDSRDKINLEMEMKRLLLRVVTRALITPELEINAHPFIEALDDVFNSANMYTTPKLFPKSSKISHKYYNRSRFPSYVRDSLSYIDGFAEQVAGEFMNINSERGFLLEQLYRPYLAKEISFAQVISAIKYSLISIALPAAEALTFLFFEMNTQPGLRRKIETELDSAEELTDPRAFMEGSPTLRSAVYETCRLYPPVFALHLYVAREEVLKEYVLRQGTQVMIAPYVVHRDSAVWQDPLTFDAERFLQFARPDDISYMPFGFENAYSPTDLGIYLCMRVASQFAKDMRVYFYKKDRLPLRSTAVVASDETLFTKVEPRNRDRTNARP
jgi:cytochrome P450